MLLGNNAGRCRDLWVDAIGRLLARQVGDIFIYLRHILLNI